jgi:hypothetical protein
MAGDPAEWILWNQQLSAMVSEAVAEKLKQPFRIKTYDQFGNPLPVKINVQAEIIIDDENAGAGPFMRPWTAELYIEGKTVKKIEV